MGNELPHQHKPHGNDTRGTASMPTVDDAAKLSSMLMHPLRDLMPEKPTRLQRKVQRRDRIEPSMKSFVDGECMVL
jgi:hypothetical protein